jgi:hydroxymethylpyrimidine/phosphomethylpyrimidine kinase
MDKQGSRRSQSAATIPIVLSIAGSDSSAGAGIQADLKTFSALGVYGLTAVTCVVAEIPGKVSSIEPVSANMINEQIEVLARNFQVTAVKTGLLCTAAIVSAVAKALRPAARMFPARVPLVIDPIIVATSGDSLLEPAAIEAYKKELFPLGSLITPNLDEAERLLGTRIRDPQAMHRAGKALEKTLGIAVLLKGGHLANEHAVDLLFANGKVVEFSAPFIRGVATHGTGCTYSAAITAGLGKGQPLEEAITQAKKFVTDSIMRRFRWTSRLGKNLDALRQSL